MNTDEQHAHFAWDLLDSAKRVAVPQGTQEQVVEKRVTPEPPRRSQPSESRPTQLRSAPMPEASLIAESKPPAAIAPPAPEAPTGEPFTTPFRPDSALEEAPSRAREPEPLPVRLPVIGQQTLPVRSDGDIPKLNWIDVGRSIEPGQYRSRYGLVQLRAEDIWIWKMHPHAAFVVMQPSPFSEENVSWLGSFDLGDQGDFAEDKK